MLYCFLFKQPRADNYGVQAFTKNGFKNWKDGPKILYEHVVHGKNASDNILSMMQSKQEVICIVQKQKLFKGNDLNLLLEAFLT